jgi:diketogulonate reductase-like aldo/keto reductase
LKAHRCPLIDTAELYKNEEKVGEAIRNSGIPREELFISTKIWLCGREEEIGRDPSQGVDFAKQLVHDNLSRLGLSYIDLILIHSPHCKPYRLNVYRSLCELQQAGLVRHVGVSNYAVHHIQEIVQAGLPLPAVNQLELHPFLQRADLVRYCQERHIVLQAYSPLVKGKKMDHPTLVAIASKHGKTPAQVLIRWGLQMGFVEIPKSTHPHRIDENFHVFDFELDHRDMEEMHSLDAHYVSGWDPTKLD